MNIDLKKYLKAPEKCPYCGTKDLRKYNSDFSCINAYQDVTCNKCNKTWTEVFTITEITEEDN